MAQRKFPYTVKRGSAVVKIYLTPTKGHESFTVSYWSAGKRVRKTYATFDIAKAEAEKAANHLTSGDIDVLTLTSQDRAAYLRAREHLAPLGVPIETAALEYAEAKRRIGEASLAEAIDCYLRHHPKSLVPRLVSDVIEEFIAAKEKAGVSHVYVLNLRYNFRKVTERFHCNIGDITGADLDQWMTELEFGPRTRNNLRASLKSLFNFAKARKYLPKEHDEIEAITLAKDKSTAIEIFTPAELKAILAHAPERIIPFLTLGAFAGIRHAEIKRLDWKDIKFDESLIEVSAAKAKTASRRIVPLLDNLKEWLLPHKQAGGTVCPLRQPSDDIGELTRAVRAVAKPRSTFKNFNWKHNALRHSFISYRVCVTQNVAQVALEAGNSPQMIFSNYRELVTPKAAEAWFQITP